MKFEFILAATECVAHNAIVTLPVGVVELAFTSPIYPIDSLIITARHGDRVKNYRPVNGVVDITELCDRAGLVEIVATLEARGVAAKTWQIAPLVVKEIDGKFEPIPYIVELEKRVTTLEKALVELTNLYT